MNHSLVTRRFVRIKALQSLYAYTITQQALKKEAIEEIEKNFAFDIFLHEPSQKKQLQQEGITAVKLFHKALEKPSTSCLFSSAGNRKIELSASKTFFHFIQELKQLQTSLQKTFNQSKENIYTNHLYVLLLLVEWYKWSQPRKSSSPSTQQLLQNKIVGNSLLEELYKNSNWIDFLNKKRVSWPQGGGDLHEWYKQFILSSPGPLATPSDGAYPEEAVKILDYIIQTIIFKNEGVKDFFSMIDLCWDQHEFIVKKMLTQTFKLIAKGDFVFFTLFWENLELKWKKEELLYKQLLNTAIQNNNFYENLIGKKAEKWDKKRILLIDKLIMILALSEIFECKEIPLKASINEYIEIAKWYGSAKSGAFINGVLEGVLKEFPIKNKV